MFLFSFATQSFANTVIVSGTVKYADGIVIANRAVTIYSDTINASSQCANLTRVKFTNANGYYIDTITCAGNISVLRVSTPDCNGTVIFNTVTFLPATPNAVSNFTLSCNSTPTCTANFTTSAQGNAVNFTNTSVTSGTLTVNYWTFGDGTTSTLVNPVHVYTAPGIYNACLRIESTTTCRDSICKAVLITVPTNSCNAEFTGARDSLNYRLFKFVAGQNTLYPNNDPVVERKWKWGDGDSLLGNVQLPTHLYAQAGTYTVCLRVKTQSGCVSEFCKTITIVNPAASICYATFTYLPQLSFVAFNSINSSAYSGDSIIYRKWVWGDSTAALVGNEVAPQHQYAQAGVYLVCLTIKTASGCEKTFCKMVNATNVNTNCAPQFIYQKVTPKKIEFNSAMSWTPANDSIIYRRWSFGDNTYLATGNVISPVHEYPTFGIYTACLKIKTALGCEKEICKTVYLQDTISITTNAEPIRILNLYPNPVTTQFTTWVYSAYNNVNAELAVFDIYGLKKWSINKTLMQGNNITIIPTTLLLRGPYVFKVITSSYGIRSRPFFKL